MADWLADPGLYAYLCDDGFLIYRSHNGNDALFVEGGLAALYAGTPVTALRQAGLAAGGLPEQDAALDAAFAGTAYMLDGF